MNGIMTEHEIKDAVGKFRGITSTKFLSQEFVDVLIDLYGRELARDVFADWLAGAIVYSGVYGAPTIYMAFPFRDAREVRDMARIINDMLTVRLKIPAQVLGYSKVAILDMGRTTRECLMHNKLNLVCVMAQARRTLKGAGVRSVRVPISPYQAPYFQVIHGKIFDRLADKTHAGFSINEYRIRVHARAVDLLKVDDGQTTVDDFASGDFCDRFM